MVSFEDRLTEALREVADEVAPGASLDDRVWAGVTQPRTPSRRPLAVVLAAGLALATAAVLVAQPWAARPIPLRTLGGGALSSAGAGSWTALPKAPIAVRDQFLEAWTGSSMLVFGGYRMSDGGEAMADGASFNPSSGSWSILPKGPLPAIDGPVGAWTGTEFLVFGAPSSDGPEPATSPGAAYNPATQTWRSLAPFPLGALADSASYAVWTGSRLLVWGFFGNDSANSERGTTDTRAALYDPATNRWSETSPAPVEAPIFGDAFWTGSELLVWGQAGTSGSSTGHSQLVSYSPSSDSWKLLGQPPASISGNGAAAWTGTELVVGGGSANSSAAAFNPSTGAWRSLPDAPEAFTGSMRYSDLWTGTDVLILDDGDAQGRPLLFDPATNQWRFGAASPVVGRTDSPAVWDGSQALVWGGGTPEKLPAPAVEATAELPSAPGASAVPTPLPASPGGPISCCNPVTAGYRYTPPSH